MGCDIHAHVEIKKDGEWIHWQSLRIERDYDLFEKMAGVRGHDDNAISAPRGLPDDVSASSKLASDIDGEDGHSHSWLSLAEMIELEAWIESRPNRRVRVYDSIGYLFGNGWKDFGEPVPEYCEAKAKELGVSDVRLVFWFDN
jgi:hypothetical protein